MPKSDPIQHLASRERNFYTGLAVSMAVVVFAGFARTFFLAYLYAEPHPLAPTETIFYIHGAIAAAWMALLIIQPTLIRQNNFALHKKLGSFGAVLASLVVLVGLWATLIAAARPEGFIGVPIPPLQFLAIIGFNIVMFGVLVGFAIHFRDKPQYHKRLMLLATTNLLQAAVVRIPLDLIANGHPLLSFVMPYIFILALIVWDWSTLRRIHPATLWGGLAIILSLPLRFWFAESDAWLAIAAWSVNLLQ
jgi:hypothetical protein